MKTLVKTFCLLAILYMPAAADAQTDDNEALKIAAMEALVTAPPERALPIVQKVLASNESDELKARSLFILSQIDSNEAQALLVDTARNSTGELQSEAIRMIGIGGNAEAVAELSTLYASGDKETREAVLEAYLILGDAQPVLQIALDTEDKDDFDAAVEMLGAMGATEELRALRERSGVSDALIDAYAVAGEIETLEALARDASDPEMQARALEALGVAGGAGTTLAEIYNSSDDPDVREAALNGMMIGGHDDRLLELFRSSSDTDEQRAMLEMLVRMDSDEVLDIIDQILETGE